MRLDLLTKLKQRNQRESKPFVALFELQGRLSETNLQLRSENSSLNLINQRLKEENQSLKSKCIPPDPSSIQSNENYLELQRKLFSLQEEVTELHRKKGDNAQQVIDLSAAVKGNEAVIAEKQAVIESLEAELLGVREDLKNTEAHMSELESTNQLLKAGICDKQKVKMVTSNVCFRTSTRPCSWR